MSLIYSDGTDVCCSKFYIELHYESILSLLHVSESNVLGRRKANVIHSSILNTFEKLGRLSNKNVVLFLFLFTFTISAPMLIGFEMGDDVSREENKDIKIFRDRAQTILDGELLYRDTEMITVSPPVINYLFLPVLILGDTLLLWCSWFAFFLFLTSVVLFFFLEPWFDRRLAIAGSMIYSSSPFGQFTSIAMLQDDAIIVTFLALSMLFLSRKRWYLAAASLGLGTVTKLFPALCSPFAVLGPDKWESRMYAASIGLGIAFLISLPFLMYAPSDYTQFLEFYLSGIQPDSDTQTSYRVSLTEQRGMSFWRFMGETIYFVPSAVLHLVMLVSLIVTWVAVHQRKLEIPAAFSLSILSIFVFYSKIHYGYHLMALLVLIPWALHDAKRIWGVFGMSFLAAMVHLAWRDRFFTDNSWVHLAFAFTLWLYWIYWAKIIIQNPDFTQRNKVRSQESILIACGWIVILCMAYSLQVGIVSALG